MKRYTKKPVTVEAVQWTGENLQELKNFVGSSLEYDIQYDAREVGKGPAAVDVRIRTLEGVHHATEGDFIIKGVHGEFYPCKPDIFQETYVEAEKLEAIRELQEDRIRELVEADREGRCWIIPKCEGKICGACGHFQRIPGTRRGKCDVRPYANSKWRGSGGDKREFEPSQSHIACNQFVPADCTDSGGGNAGT